MPGQLSQAEKEERVRRAGELVGRLRREYLASRVGGVEQVLFETAHTGHSGSYCPVRVARTMERGTVRNIRVTAVSGDALLGEPAEPSN